MLNHREPHPPNVPGTPPQPPQSNNLDHQQRWITKSDPCCSFAFARAAGRSGVPLGYDAPNDRARGSARNLPASPPHAGPDSRMMTHPRDTLTERNHEWAIDPRRPCRNRPVRSRSNPTVQTRRKSGTSPPNRPQPRRRSSTSPHPQRRKTRAEMRPKDRWCRARAIRKRGDA